MTGYRGQIFNILTTDYTDDTDTSEKLFKIRVIRVISGSLQKLPKILPRPLQTSRRFCGIFMVTGDTIEATQ